MVMQDIDNFTQDFLENPTSALVTMKCFPWSYWDKVALVGDAAHAIVPFYGQGMNAGFEDIFRLDALMDQHSSEWEALFKAYEQDRKPNADAIAELSYRNFIEMSQKTANPMFLLQKKIERKFADAYPDKWTPVYSRVTFSEQPYAEALAIGDAQEAIMKQILKRTAIEVHWDSPEVMEAMLALLEEGEVGK